MHQLPDDQHVESKQDNCCVDDSNFLVQRSGVIRNHQRKACAFIKIMQHIQCQDSSILMQAFEIWLIQVNCFASLNLFHWIKLSFFCDRESVNLADVFWLTVGMFQSQIKVEVIRCSLIIMISKQRSFENEFQSRLYRQIMQGVCCRILLQNFNSI